MTTGDMHWAIGRAVELALANQTKTFGVFRNAQQKAKWAPHLVDDRLPRGFDMVMSVHGKRGIAFVYLELE